MSSSPHALPEATALKLAELWHRKLPQTLQRLDQLDYAATVAADGALTPTLRAEAASFAHIFAGTLGTFGYGEGTRLARELEQLWESPLPDPTTLATLTAQLRRALPLLPMSS